MTRNYVLGLDISAHACGWAVLTPEGGLLDSGMIYPVNQDAIYWTRQSEIIGGIKEILVTYPDINLAAMEEVRLFHQGGINFRAIRDLCRLGGSIGLVMHQQNISLLEVATNSWRKVVLGNGRATKEDVVKWVRENYNLEVLATDQAEAVGIGRWAIAPKTISTSPVKPRKRRATNGTRKKRGNRAVAIRARKR
jgi:Holliday junction resolvasome RuvABC endonuclease subunit